MDAPVSPLVFALLLLIGMLVLLEIGRRVASRRRLKEPEDANGSLATIEGAVLALFGLLMAFTFSGAASRFNEKRMLVAEEANRIETAYLRLHLLAERTQPRLQELFRLYTDSRLEIYRKLPNVKAAEEETKKSKELQKKIWTDAIVAASDPKSHPDAGKLLLPAVNAMIDITTIRKMELQNHPPNIIYWLLFALGLLCSLLAGYRMARTRRSWLHIFSFVFITVMIVYVILDLEFPRIGLFRLASADQALVDVLQEMH